MKNKHKIFSRLSAKPTFINAIILKSVVFCFEIRWFDIVSCFLDESYTKLKPENAELKISCVVTFSDIRRFYLLKEAIQSIKNQTYSNYEIIIVDGTSQLGESRERLMGMYDDRFLIEPYKSSSPGDARNFGSQFATGDILIFLDDDNLFVPFYFQQLATWYTFNPKVDVALFRFIIIEGDFIYDVPISRKYSRSLLFKRNPSDTNVMSFKIHNGNLPKWAVNTLHEDWILLKESELNNLVIKSVNNLAVLYRKHNLNRTNPKSSYFHSKWFKRIDFRKNN